MKISADSFRKLELKKRLKHKHKAIRCERDEIKFPSKLERQCYDILKQAKEKGTILFFLRQIPFDLPGKHTHRVDFLIFRNEDCFFVEAKGRDLPEGKMKREQSEEIYGVKIHVVKNSTDLYSLLHTEEL